MYVQVSPQKDGLWRFCIRPSRFLVYMINKLTSPQNRQVCIPGEITYKYIYVKYQVLIWTMITPFIPATKCVCRQNHTYIVCMPSLNHFLQLVKPRHLLCSNQIESYPDSIIHTHLYDVCTPTRSLSHAPSVKYLSYFTPCVMPHTCIESRSLNYHSLRSLNYLKEEYIYSIRLSKDLIKNLFTRVTVKHVVILFSLTFVS